MVDASPPLQEVAERKPKEAAPAAPPASFRKLRRLIILPPVTICLAPRSLIPVKSPVRVASEGSYQLGSGHGSPPSLQRFAFSKPS